ncbi:helicase [Armadillidium vulgare iridescent virus]|uniref:ATP-dependent DNA helicase PIF1 n=1 Tax=Armadillidium vulgare iridescent virus TaxID=72201 RepID=A0A068QLS1_9VIRU|nr:helicase [Armadillidium vulgare iridescent virus]CCV02569.1 ATP-dependent DNA helicase PIF1 [Armadillidium vulgare iridescent virus]
METEKLNNKQEKAYKMMVAGENIFITAPAGTGKTFLINYFCKTIDPIRTVAITSTTGVSSLLIGGSTLHSYLGIGLGDGTTDQLFHKIVNCSKGIKAAVWRKLQTLIIDEVSMLSPILFDKLECLARQIRGNNKPFGGIQLILSGDLLQLPVVKGGGVADNGSPLDFVTDASSWGRCVGNNVVLLTEIMRQKDPLFKEILLKIRVGCIDAQVKEVLNNHISKNVSIGEYDGDYDEEDYEEDYNPGVAPAPDVEANKEESELKIQPTKLFCLKRYVKALNDKELQKLENAGVKFKNFNALIKAFSSEEINSVKGRSKSSEAQFNFLKDRFVKDCTTPQQLRICEGAQVMLTYNINQPMGLVNGSRGVITSFSEKKFPVVKFVNGLELEILPQTWEFSNDNGKKVGYFKQIPLKIAYALTVHSCQGATLDCAEVDLKDTFEHGQVYTALSRTRDLDSLVIKNLDFDKIKCHPRALDFYKNLQKIEEELEQLALDFKDINFDDEF